MDHTEQAEVAQQRDQLLNRFFEAVHLRRLGECQQALAALTALTRHDPGLEIWCRYLSGILAFEVEKNWERAAAIFRGLLTEPLTPAMCGRITLALGRTLEVQGQWAEAIETFTQAVDQAEAQADPYTAVKALNEIAIVCYRQFEKGDESQSTLDDGIVHARRALLILESETPETPDEVETNLQLRCHVWTSLGLLHRCLRNYAEALGCYQADLTICEQRADQLGIGVSHANIGEVYHRMGEPYWPDALSQYEKALPLIAEFDASLELLELRCNLAHLHHEMGHPHEALNAYRHAVQIMRDLRSLQPSADVQKSFMATLAETYAHIVLLCLEVGEIEAAFAYCEEARTQQFLVEFSDDGDLTGVNSPKQSISLQEVQATLPEESLILAYFTTGLLTTAAAQEEGIPHERHRFPPARTLLFAISHDSVAVQTLEISPNALRPNYLASVVERHFLQPSMQRELYDRLLRPQEDAIRHAQKLIIVPHGPLHYIPFRFLLDSTQESLSGHGTHLSYAAAFTPLTRGSGRSTRPPSALVLGYNGSEPLLHFTEAEAHAIAEQTGGLALIGDGPKLERLFDQVAHHSILHIACHGEFVDDDPLQSFLALAPNERLVAQDVMTRLQARLDLVTLSACESGLGRVRRGDEVEGLVRAFFQAGASAVLASLWQVNEVATLLFMGEYYRSILRGHDYARSLNDAQIYLRNLTYTEACRHLDETGDGQAALAIRLGLLPPQDRPFAEARHWAAFVLFSQRY